MRKLLGVAVTVFMLSLLGAAWSKAADEPKEGLEVGNRFPHYDTFSAKTIDGEDITLKSYEGTVLFIDFWASWCGPCREELPYLAIAQGKYVGDKLSILGISLDTSIDSLRAMAKEYGLDYPQICDGKGWQSTYATTFSVRSIPTNFLLDGNGVILAKDMRGLAAEGHIDKALGLDTPAAKYAETMDYLMSTEKPDIPKAIGMLEEAIKGDPKQPEFHFLAAQLQFADGNTDKAAEQLEECIKNKDKLPVLRPLLQSYVLLGRLRYDAGNVDGATEMIDEAIKTIHGLGEDKQEEYASTVSDLEKLKAMWLSDKDEDDS